MNFIFTERFYASLQEIEYFIANDSIQRAIDFRDELYFQISKIAFMPRKHRKNQTLNDENIRDMIFKGYVIPFRIEGDSIVILNIYKHNIPDYS